MEDKERTERTNKTSAWKKVHPRQRANFLSKLCFCWTLPFFIKGFKRDITENDLYGPLKVHESKRLGDLMEEAWIKEKKSRSSPSLWRVLRQVYGFEMFLYGLLIIVLELIVKMAQPLLLGKLMLYYSPNQTTITKEDAYFYASGIILVQMINTIMSQSYYFGVQHLGMKVRIGCCSLIYRKTLQLSKTAMIQSTVGQTVNLMANDVKRFDLALVHLHQMFVAPFETILVTYLLYASVNPAALAGIVLLLALIPIQVYLGKRTSHYRFRTAVKTDQRVRLMNEIISGIQVIKMYTWEKPFTKLVQAARKIEIHQIKGASYLRAITFSFMIFVNRTAIFFCVITYVLTGNMLTAEYVYVLSSYYGLLRQALTMFLPRGITSLAETNVSVRRLETFLSYDEVRKNYDNVDLKLHENGTTKSNDKANKPHQEINQNIGINMKEVCTKWCNELPDYTLNKLDFAVAQKQLVAVVGPIGSGKSTLLHVILREIEILSGTLNISGTISYASQEPWLFTASIRQNILFGEDMDFKKYKHVVKICALERDFSLFPYGDRTIVGERGVMLSGGQKARISLARAVYKNADIYLLDDPLSAVDAHVGKQLFDNCISGYLKDKCTVLVTHQLQYLTNVDQIYLLENGNITANGTYEQLRNSGGEFVKLLEENKEPAENDEKSENSEVNIRKVKSQKSIEEKNETDLPVENKEHRSTGSLSKRVYKKYFKAGGSYYYSIGVLFLFVITQTFGSGVDLFVKFWVNLDQDKLMDQLNNKQNDSYQDANIRNNSDFVYVEESFFTALTCIYIYSGLIVFMIIFTLVRSLSFFKVCMNASTNLHNDMFSNIVYATIRFFNTNPSGRILNRFSKDIGSIDEIVPQTLLDTMQVGMNVISITFVLSSISVWIIIPTIGIFGLFYFYKVVFLSTSGNLKRIEGTTRSPVFSHLTASLQGLSTIRAFKAQEILRKEFDQHQDLNSSAFYMFSGCTRTFAFWLDMHCIVYVGFVILSFLFIGTETYGGNVGLAITQCMSLTTILQWGLRQWSDLENQMTSVERVLEYTDLPKEPDEGKKIPPKNWPNHGNLVFESVFMQYSEDDQFVLKNLSFKVQAGEKIGIVGRTGAGKSSLISALFRLAQIEGNIFIDDINTKEITLNMLRSKISIIPQEPVLFSGTLRKNLDPFDEYHDSKIWQALEEVNMKSVISDLPSGLLCTVSESGSNFSVGQRQLFCLARALIRSNKILILDEATANVDPQTDELIQSTLRKTFKNCTVLTIAHRLHTVMDSDKILVMDSGRAVQFDHPHKLLQDNDGMFYLLVQQTGKWTAETLAKIAEENFMEISQAEVTG